MGAFLLHRFAECAVAFLDRQSKGALRNLNRLCKLPGRSWGIILIYERKS
jgi:hypothetical protein